MPMDDTIQQLHLGVKRNEDEVRALGHPQNRASSFTFSSNQHILEPALEKEKEELRITLLSL